MEYYIHIAFKKKMNSTKNVLTQFLIQNWLVTHTAKQQSFYFTCQEKQLFHLRKNIIVSIVI